MTWGDNDLSIDNYIESLEAVPYNDNGEIKTGKDNYIKIIDRAKESIEKRISEKEKTLSIVSKKLSKVNRLIDKIELDMSDNNTLYDYQIFNTNISQLVNNSNEFNILNTNLVATISTDYRKLKEYKRTKRELLSVYNDLTNSIDILSDYDEVLDEVLNKFNS